MDVCRLCLSESLDPVSVQEVRKGYTVIDVINSVIPEISIELSDPFSKYICGNSCWEILTRAYELKLLSIENQIKLKQCRAIKIKTERENSPPNTFDDSYFDEQGASKLDPGKGLPLSRNRFEEVSLLPMVEVKLEEGHHLPGPSTSSKKDKLKCYLCLFECRFEKTLDKHMAKHENGQLKTNIRNKFVPAKRIVKKSRTSKGNRDEKLQCSVCKFQCRFQKTLDKHLENHVQPRTRTGPRICGFCNVEFPSLTELKLHEFIHCDYVEEYVEPGPRIFVCSLCPDESETERDLQIHLLSHTVDFNSEKIPFCIKCPRLFHNFESLVTHTSIHNELITHRCLKCFKKFSSTGKKLLKHLRRHSSFTCDFCGMNTDNKPRLEEHILAFHMSYKQFLCTGCGESFASKNSMQLHVKHKHENERNYKCTLCPKTFFRNMDLLNHQGVHTKVASFQCDKCPKRFKAYRNLDRHQTFHNPAKVQEMRNRHLCEFPGCGRGFLTNYSRARHFVSHTGAVIAISFLIHSKFYNINFSTETMAMHRRRL